MSVRKSFHEVGPADKPSPAVVDRVLRRALIATVLAAGALLAYGTILVYQGQPPIPDQVVANDGTVLYSREDILAGKALFQRADLMDFGSLYGNGAYFGPDWGTDYLHRETVYLRDTFTRRASTLPYLALSTDDQAAVDAQVTAQVRANRYADGVLALTAEQAAAHDMIRNTYQELFLQGDRRLGLPAGTLRSAAEADQLTAFFGWVAWTSVAPRPGQDLSYTNNWPYEPVVGNTPTASMWTWSLLSLVTLVFMAVVVFVVYQRYIAAPADAIRSPSMPLGVAVTPSQRGAAKWFLLVPALLLAQGLAGSLMAHYYAEREGFFGLDLPTLLPFNILHAWHIQIAIAWIAAAWLGAGLFLGPLIGRREPRRQALLANALWAAVVLVVVGSLAGIWLGVKTDLGDLWWWVGNQGLEYLQLGRAFQVALFVGLLLWAAILARAFWPALRQRRGWGSMEHLLLYSGLGVGVLYGFGMLPLNQAVATTTLVDYWRWFVVHLWVEGVFEFFTVAVTGFALLSMGLLPRRMVERTVYFELILIFGSGIIGMGHHFYWVGEPFIWLAVGSMFSMLEVIPLGVMMLRAWREYGAIFVGRQVSARLPFLYFTSAAVWNLLGAGVLGGVVNPPIVSYFEHGEFLTAAHGHASMFGVFGLLALGLLYLALRGLVHPDHWSNRLGIWALASFNTAIVLWLALNILPIGTAQFSATVEQGYWYARSVGFYQHWIVFHWLRLPGDVAFLIGGGLVLLDVVSKLRYRRVATIGDGQSMDLAVQATPATS